MAQVKTTIKIDESLTERERRAVAQEVIDYIVERSKKGRDKNEDRFPGYSKEYIDSLDFTIAGKSASRVDLTLSGEMLNSIKLLRQRRGEIEIGFDGRSKTLNAKAEGNIIGSYGKPSGDPKKARDFLGIKDTKLDEIQAKYTSDRARTLRRLAVIERFRNG